MRIFKRLLSALVIVAFSFATLSVGQATLPTIQNSINEKIAAPEKIVTGVEHKVIKGKFKASQKKSVKHAKILLSRRKVVKKKTVKKKVKKVVKAAVVQPAAAPNPTAQFNGTVEQQIVAQVNTIRSQKGLHTLHLRGDLQNFARQWSLQQYDNGRMSHGMLNFQRKSIAGQNVAYAEGDVNYFGWGPIWSAQATMNNWMNSPGHRANILNPNYRYIGVGVVYGERNGGTDGWVYFTQDFSN